MSRPKKQMLFEVPYKLMDEYHNLRQLTDNHFITFTVSKEILDEHGIDPAILDELEHQKFAKQTSDGSWEIKWPQKRQITLREPILKPTTDLKTKLEPEPQPEPEIVEEASITQQK